MSVHLVDCAIVSISRAASHPRHMSTREGRQTIFERSSTATDHHAAATRMGVGAIGWADVDGRMWMGKRVAVDARGWRYLSAMTRPIALFRSLFSGHWLAKFALVLSVLVSSTALFVAVAGLPEQVEAQQSGGSFGGSNWGGSRRDNSGSSSGARSPRTSPNRPTTSRPTTPIGGSTGYSNRPSGSPGGPAAYRSGRSGGVGGIFCLLVIVLGFAAVILLSRRKGKGGGAGAPLDGDSIVVTQLQLGLDWRARPALQTQFAQLAASGDTQSPEGLVRTLGETVLAIRRQELSWLYAGYIDLGPLDAAQAQSQFQQLANDARARFQTETIRGRGGHVQTAQAPEIQARANEGAGTVVVTLVLATRRRVQGMEQPSADQIRGALGDRGAIAPDDLAAMEVIWSPSVDSDRLSTSELEQFYPELRLIDPNSIAGRVFCAYCSAPFPMELLSCPNCGAPAEASRDRREPPR